jgi:hypothetical protein
MIKISVYVMSEETPQYGYVPPVHTVNFHNPPDPVFQLQHRNAETAANAYVYDSHSQPVFHEAAKKRGRQDVDNMLENVVERGRYLSNEDIKELDNHHYKRHMQGLNSLHMKRLTARGIQLGTPEEHAKKVIKKHDRLTELDRPNFIDKYIKEIP